MIERASQQRSVRFLSLVVAAVLAAAFTVTAAPAAQASAERSVWVPMADGLTIEKAGFKAAIPKGVFTFKVEGEDRWVESIGGSFHSPLVPVSNWHVRVVFVDLAGKVDEWFDGEVHPSQDRRGDWNFPINRQMQYGQVCGFLFSNGQPIKTAGICHNITRPYIIQHGDDSGPYKAGQKVGRIIKKLNPFD